MLVEVFYENGGEGAPHKHPHEQAAYCLEGEFEFTIGDETKVIKAGDTIYMPSDVMHGCKLLSEKGRLLDIFTPQREDFLNH
jgi:quercetin dioxygenase-like cupin family protein